VINTKKPPFDNVLLRYALNMATDKKAITHFVGAGRVPALNFVPPIEGYEAPQSLLVQVVAPAFHEDADQGAPAVMPASLWNTPRRDATCVKARFRRAPVQPGMRSMTATVMLEIE